MPNFMQTSLKRHNFNELEKRRGKFFPFFDKFQAQRDTVTVTESLGTVVDTGTSTTLKFSADVSSSAENQQTAEIEGTGFPNIIVEFAPNNDFDETKHAPTGFTDITQFVRKLSGDLRQRTYEIGRFEAGSLSVGLDNHDGRFTPGSQRSPYFPNIKANRRLRVRGKNLQNSNIATGGGDYGNTIGFSQGTGDFSSNDVTDPVLVQHDPFLLPYGLGTRHIESTLVINASPTTATRDIIEWYAPVELGVRMTHSAYIWKTSGIEAQFSKKSLIAVYFDSEGNELSPVDSDACRTDWTDETPTTPTRYSFSDQPPALAKYCLIKFRVEHTTMRNVYSPVTWAFTGIQAEIPENNLVPLVDQINFSVQGTGNTLNDGSGFGVNLSWGAGAAGSAFHVPRLIPGDTYTFAARVKKLGVDLMMTADDGQSGVVLDNEEGEIDVWASFIANKAEEEIKFIPLEPLPPVATNLALNKGTTGTTACEGCGQSPCGETSDKAVNGSWTGGLSDKFCSHTVPGLLTINLGEMRDLSGFIVRHARAGGETANYNTRDFEIQTSPDNTTFTTVVTVAANTLDTTMHPAPEGTRGQWVRLRVTTGTQIGDTAMRIYEFEAYGTDGLLPTTSGTVLSVKQISVAKGFVPGLVPTPVGSQATPEQNGLTAWEAPKPIFEGWTEDWPAKAGDLTSSVDITVNDRSARLGKINLNNTLRESLFQDDPVFLIPLDDDPIDSQGMVSNLGSWSRTNGMITLEISGMNTDMTGSSYVQGVEGPTDDNAIQFNRTSAGAGLIGYVIPMPYTAEFVPKLSPPSNPEGPLPIPAEGAVVTKNYFATWSHTYMADGNLRSDDSPNYVYQGDCTDGDASCSGNGDNRSLVGFNVQSIISDLTGAVIKYVGLSVHAQHWWWFDGGYGIFGTHDYLNRNGPTTWENSHVQIGRWRTGRFRRDSWQTIDLGVDTGYEFLSNTITGISVGPAQNKSLNYYGYFDGAGLRYKPYLTIQYIK
jgi:hypothetical protein